MLVVVECGGTGGYVRIPHAVPDISQSHKLGDDVHGSSLSTDYIPVTLALVSRTPYIGTLG